VRVDAPRGPTEVTGPRRAAGSGRSAWAPPATGATQGPPLRGAGPLAAAGTILAIQQVEAVEDASARRARAIRRGERLLDLLDGLRHGMLDGRIPATTLRNLHTTLAERIEVEDEDLAGLLAEIDLRAAVELAKLEVAAARASNGAEAIGSDFRAAGDPG